jgi:hypothetical protein
MFVPLEPDTMLKRTSEAADQSAVRSSNPIPIDTNRQMRTLMWGFRRRRTLIPEGTRTAFPAEGEQLSERSDAGISIVQEVFAFVKENYPERSGGRVPLAEKGARGKGRSPCPRLGAQSPGERQLDGCVPRFLRMESPRISMRCAL